MRTKLLTSAVAALVAHVVSLPSLVGQSALTYPPFADTTELPDLEFWALSPFAARRQILIDQAAIGIRAGREIEALTVRRDGDTIEGVLGGRVQIRLTISNAPRAAAQAEEEFAANLGLRPSVVFDGVVALPSLGPPDGVPVAWSGSGAVRLPFTAPWRAGGPTLCIDTVTQPFIDPITRIVDAPFWPIDLSRPPEVRAGTRTGASCIGSPDPAPAGLLAEALQPGATMVFHLGQAPENSAILCAVGSSRSAPLRLDDLGAPGCALHVDVMTTLLPLPITQQQPGLARARLLLPNLTELGGFEVASQWIAIIPGVTPLGLVTSNRAAGVLQVTSSPWEATWVESTDVHATHGTLFPRRAPVMRFHLR